jgi:hypothetical protein
MNICVYVCYLMRMVFFIIARTDILVVETNNEILSSECHVPHVRLEFENFLADLLARLVVFPSSSRKCIVLLSILYFQQHQKKDLISIYSPGMRDFYQ